MNPTSQRDNFEQNAYRDDFYKKGIMIPTILNKIARKSTRERIAVKYLREGNKIINKVGKDIKSFETYLKELTSEKINRIEKAINDIKSREKNLPENKMYFAHIVINDGNGVLKKLKEIKKFYSDYDITVKLKFEPQAKDVYLKTINTLKKSLKNDPEKLEKSIRSFHDKLL